MQAPCDLQQSAVLSRSSAAPGYPKCLPPYRVQENSNADLKPVIFLCDPALPIQDKSYCDKTPAAVFIFVFMVGLLYAGDKLVEVNGVPVEGLEPEQVINILVFNIFKICFLLCTLRLFVCSLFYTLLYMRRPGIFNRKFRLFPYSE